MNIQVYKPDFANIQDGIPNSELPPNWNVGILEYWNHGLWENGIVGLRINTNSICIDPLIIAAYFLWEK